MTDRDRLIKTLQNRTKDRCHLQGLYEWADDIADYLIANGVIVPTCKQRFCEFVNERRTNINEPKGTKQNP